MSVLVLVLLGQTMAPVPLLPWAEEEACGRTGGRCAEARTGGRPAGSLAFFEFAPQNGAGMGSACACAPVTGARGEAVTFSRTGAATCSPLGLATTGIGDATLVECAGNLPRVEASGGVNGLRVESLRVNSLLRFIDFANATWVDVATPTLTGAQPSPFTGTYANLAVRFDDNDAAAQEGRAQTVTVTAGVAHTMHCYVKAGTLASAAISLDGTVTTISGLSTTAWSIIEVTDASSSGVAISAQVLNGSTAAATGTVIWGGCQVEAGAYRTSIIPTVAAAVTRNDEGGSVAVVVPNGAGCIAGSLQTSANTLVNGRIASVWLDSNNRFESFIDATSPTVGVTVGGVFESTFTTAATMPGGPFRVIATRVPSTTRSMQLVGNAPTSAASALGAFTPTTIFLGRFGASLTNQPMGILTRIQIDPDPTRCAP